MDGKTMPDYALAIRSGAPVVPPAGVTVYPLQQDPALEGALGQYNKFLFDFLDPICWPKQATGIVNDPVIDLSLNAANGRLGTANPPSFSPTRGMIVDATANQAVYLPASARVASTSKGFLFTVWVYLSGSQGQKTVFGYHLNASGPYGMYSNSGQNAFVIVYDGTAVPITVSGDGWYQVAIGRYSNDGGSTYGRRFRVTRMSTGGTIAQAAGTSGSTAAQPSTPIPTTVRLGDNVETQLATEWVGAFARCGLWDVGTVADVMTQAYLDAIVDADFAARQADFNALLT